MGCPHCAGCDAELGVVLPSLATLKAAAGRGIASSKPGAYAKVKTPKALLTTKIGAVTVAPLLFTVTVPDPVGVLEGRITATSLVAAYTMIPSTIAPPMLICTVTPASPSVVGSGKEACWS
jgi:hypothetical protein